MTLATGLIGGASLYGTAADSAGINGDRPKPTIVLVHGAWADASGWDDVAQSLQRDGYTVIAPANPLRGLPLDAAYLSSILDTISGPIVLVSHSYGGSVATNAATGRPNIKALVYVAAFAPDLGESLGSLGAMNPGSELGPATLLFRPHPTGLDAYIAPGSFRSVFAGDIAAKTSEVMAAGQRPIDAAALGQPSGVPAWQTVPSWYLVATQDHAIPPATQRFMAQRAGATTVEMASSHAAMVSKPTAVIDLILDAVHATA